MRSKGSIKNQKTREEFEHVIRYEDGITSDFVLASCSVPVNYDYTTLNVENYALVAGGRSEEEEKDNKDIKDNNNEPSSSCSNDNNSSLRFFWDGGLLANTPLRQTYLAHRHYWHRVKKLEDDLPKLQCAIINLHPLKQECIAIQVLIYIDLIFYLRQLS